MRAVGVERHRDALGAQDRRQARHHRRPALARIERRLQYALGRVIGHGNQARPGLRIQREPLMHAAVQMQHLPEARARLSAPAMPAPCPMLLDEAGRLPRLFQEAIRHRDAMLPARDLMNATDIEAEIPLAI